MKKKLKTFLLIVYISFVLLFCYLFMSKDNVLPTDILFFTLALLITNNISTIFNKKSGFFISIILPILIPAVILLDPFWVAFIAFFGTTEFKYNNFSWYKFMFNRSMFFLAGGLAALTYQYVTSYISMPFYTLPLLLSLIVYFIVNVGLVSIVVRLAGKKKQDNIILYFAQLAKNLVTSYFLGLLFYYSYIIIGKMFFVLAIILIYVLKDLLFSRIQQLNSFTQIVESFLKVIDSKDQYTEGHCERVARYTKILSGELGLSSRKTERIVNMAKIHDIGKIYVPDDILKSSDYLTDDEYEEMKKHSRYGYELLKDIDLMKKDLDIILNHHERYDGTGYPEGKKGKEIPLGARILSVCDAFDVMTTGRSYKPAMNKKQIVEEYKRCSGSQFDPVIAQKMIELIDKGRFDDSFKKQEAAKAKGHSFKPSLNYSFMRKL